MSQQTQPPFAAPSKTTPQTVNKHTETGQPIPPSDSTTQYPNNPFRIAIEGVQSIFTYAKPVAILLLVLSVLFGLTSFTSNTYNTINPGGAASSDTQTNSDYKATPISMGDISITSEDIAAIILIGGFIIFVVTVLLLVISAIFTGVGDVAAAAAVNRKTVTLKEALTTLLGRFPSYLWLIVLVAVKTFLWSLLFIIPGIIMSVRYSLAGTAFFSRNMKPNEAIKYSTQITKGGWITLFASQTLPNIVTLGFVQLLVQPGVYAELFRQYDHCHTHNEVKPKVHIVSIIYLIALILIVAAVAAILLLLVPIALQSSI